MTLCDNNCSITPLPSHRENVLGFGDRLRRREHASRVDDVAPAVAALVYFEVGARVPKQRQNSRINQPRCEGNVHERIGLLPTDVVWREVEALRYKSTDGKCVCVCRGLLRVRRKTGDSERTEVYHQRVHPRITLHHCLRRVARAVHERAFADGEQRYGDEAIPLKVEKTHQRHAKLRDLRRKERCVCLSKVYVCVCV